MPAGICVYVGEQVGRPVCAATARGEGLPEVLHVGYGRIRPSRGHVGVYHVPCAYNSVQLVCCRACGAREAGTSSQETAGCAKEAVRMQKLVSLCHENTGSLVDDEIGYTPYRQSAAEASTYDRRLACIVVGETAAAGADHKADAIWALPPARLAHDGREVAHAVYQQPPAYARFVICFARSALRACTIRMHDQRVPAHARMPPRSARLTRFGGGMLPMQSACGHPFMQGSLSCPRRLHSGLQMAYHCILLCRQLLARARLAIMRAFHCHKYQALLHARVCGAWISWEDLVAVMTYHQSHPPRPQLHWSLSQSALGFVARQGRPRWDAP